LLVLACAALTAAPALAQKTSPITKAAGDLIPRSVLFGNPDKISPQVSPDGKWISFIAPADNVLNVWVAASDKIGEARPITHDKGRGIRQAQWAFDNVHVLYLQDEGGDENWKVYSVDVNTGVGKDLTPFDSILGPDGKPITMPNNPKPLRPAAQIQQVSPKFPGEILIALNNRNPQYHDIHRVNITTGEMKLVQKNDEYAAIVTDDEFAVRLAIKPLPEGGQDLLIADGKGGFGPFQTVKTEDSLTTQPVGFNKDGTTLYMIDSRGRNTSALTAVELGTKTAKVLAEDARADAGGAMVHPTEKTVQAVSFDYERVSWKVLDPAIQGDLDYLKTVSPGDLAVDDRTLDDSKWVVSYVVDNGSPRWYLYDRKAKKASFLFAARKGLEGLTLAHVHPVVIKSRDGLDLVSYLTLPPASDADNNGRPDKPLPMVLNVHGGPWARDSWGYRGEVQWQANRGYAVLQVNYRGSTGFGKDFVNKANREWGGKMHDDLIDAVKWAVDNKVADPAKIAIYGGSYGGYATLVGMTFTPEQFACGVDIVGVANLNTFLSTIPPYWKSFLDEMKVRLGDFTTDEGKKFLASRSPVTHVDRIAKPLLVGQGYNDPRVNHDESEQMVRTMEAKKIPVTYVVYSDEGHGFARPENRTSFYAVAEAFLAQHLGGKYQAIGDDFKGSTIQVPNGADQVPGLTEALQK
jgi:dipeptidyl aminopeptidase/acylaminoacyl peptidase